MTEPTLAAPLADALLELSDFPELQLAQDMAANDARRVGRRLRADPRTVEAIAEALGSTGECGHSSCPRDTSRHLGEAAAIRDHLFGAPYE